MNYEAAKQFYEREGHLQVPRKHVERIVGEDQEEREHKLGAWVGNQRSRAATLSPEQMELLSAIGMRWSSLPAVGKSTPAQPAPQPVSPAVPRHRPGREHHAGPSFGPPSERESYSYWDNL